MVPWGPGGVPRPPASDRLLKLAACEGGRRKPSRCVTDPTDAFDRIAAGEKFLEEAVV